MNKSTSLPVPKAEPDKGCLLCPRLAAFRTNNAKAHPDWFNGPVPSFGAPDARLLLVGLAPGLQGANRTGRPFTGDYAGDLLYSTLLHFDFAKGNYAARIDDGLALQDCMISNAVRCVPPENKPTPLEARTCRSFLSARISALANLKYIIALGKIAHDSVISAHALKLGQFKFAHGAQHDLGNGLRLFDSYHCSRYNTSTKRLTEKMFHDVFGAVRKALDKK